MTKVALVSKEWIGVDLDGTLAEYHKWDRDHIGDPIPKMLNRVKTWIQLGKRIKIFTARVGCSEEHSGIEADNREFAAHQRALIEAWVEKHIGYPLEITATKDFLMTELWDDRAIQVIINTGEVVGYSTRGNDVTPPQSPT